MSRITSAYRLMAIYPEETPQRGDCATSRDTRVTKNDFIL
jgi:hypothetical protein